VAFYERGNARIHYEDQGSGFPLLLLAPGGMNSTIAAWYNVAPFNPITEYVDEYRVVAMDQRNCGESMGPLDAEDPWGMFLGDQLGLLDHLGIDRCFMLGCCIGCSYILEAIRRAPRRVVAGVLEQPIGQVEDNKERMANIWVNWGTELAKQRDDLDLTAVEAFGRSMWGNRDFVFSVTREFVRSCATPLLVMPGNDQAHPRPIGLEVADLAPKAELMDEWKGSPEVIQHTIERVRGFFKTHTPG
jgi:pimeloyl-ACP methyl ester carboxylesterase